MAKTAQWRNRIAGHADIDPAQLVPSDLNFRRHPKTQQDALSGLIAEIGYLDPVIVQAGTDRVIDGHLRVEQAIREGQATIPVTYVNLTDEEANLALASIDPVSAMAYHDETNLRALLDEVSTGDAAVMAMLSGLAEDAGVIDALEGAADTKPVDAAVARATLAERFVVPPFTVLDARQGYWQERKRAWIGLGIRGELGRGNVLGFSEHVNQRFHDGDGPLANPGRCFGQDLMRGEHTVGAKSSSVGLLGFSKQTEDISFYAKREKAKRRNLTWVKGDRDPETLDETSRKILAASPKSRVRTTRDDSLASKRNGTAAIHGHEWQRATLGHVQAPEEGSGTSIFDPVLCEIAYRWFAPRGGHVLDPFAGEATKGIVAAYLGYGYTGIEVRPEQVAVNERQAQDIGVAPEWICGDSAKLTEIIPADARYDLIFTSPPYYDLEVYSDNPEDGSTKQTYAEFMAWYRDIFGQAVSRLNENRFVVVKIGDIRDPRGAYRNFLGDNISCFLDLGLAYYNEAVLVTAVGSLPVRVGKQFSSGRKLGKTHQNILAFWKGDPRKVKESLGELSAVDFAEPQTDEGDGDR